MRPGPTSVLYYPLDEILASSALVRVARILATHGGSLAVSDIARRARLTGPSVRAALRRLIDLEVAAAAGIGRSMVFALVPDHPLTPSLVALFEAEREQARAVLHAVRAAAGSLDPPLLALWLYGSVARGQDGPSSDIDLALVSVEAQPTRQTDALRQAIADRLPGRAHRISVVALGPGDVQRLADEGGDFWRELERDAVVLAGEAPAAVRELVRAAASR